MYIFQELNDASKNITFQDTKNAQTWFQQQVKETTDPYKTFKNTETFGLGKLFLFIYDPKHKATLPFYDMYPLVFPLDMKPDGFLGLNLHYLPPAARGSLMNALYTTSNNDKYNESTKLLISYDILRQSATKFAGFQNCVKQYLLGYVRSGFHYVNPKDWDKALLLPTQKWVVNPNIKYSSKASPPY